jgi:hypothetical protein
MNAYGTPAAAGPNDDRFIPDRRDWLRLLGGILLAAGAVVLSIRKETDWSDWALLLVLLVPCAVLYGLAFAGRRWPSLQGWQSAFFAFAVLLLPIVFLQFIEAIDGDTSSRLNIAWIFGVSAAVAALTALRTDAWWQMLIAGIYAGAAWLALWAEVLDDPSGDTLRWLLILFAAILLVAALVLARDSRRVGSDLITVAGIAAVLAGGISLAGLAGASADLSGLLTDDTPNPSQGWNVFLLVVSLLLIAYGARSFTRGPGYVGAFGLLVFIGVVGADIVSRLKGEEGGGVVGWPLILLLLGAAALIASFLMPRADGGVTTEPPRFGPGGGQPEAVPPGAGAPPPPAPAAPPAQGQGGGGLLGQWQAPPPGGQQPPPQQ